MTDKIYIQGSSIVPYEITINIEDDTLKMSCTCPAGIHKQLCKHIRKVINEHEKIQEFIKSHEKYNVVYTLNEEELALEEMKKQIAKHKKQISRLILR